MSFGPYHAAQPVDNIRIQEKAEHLSSPDSSEPIQTTSAFQTKRAPERKRQESLWTSLENIIKQGRDNEAYYINQMEDTWNKLEELQMKEIELQRRQEKLEEENAHEVVHKYLQTKAKLFTPKDLERAVEDKTKQIIEDKNAALARNEKVLTDEINEIDTELEKAKEMIAKLNFTLSMCKPKEKQKLLKRLEIKEREVVKLQGLQNILVKRNTLLRDALKCADIYKADQHGHSDLSNILRPTIEKEVQLEMECNTFKAELENIKSEYESVQRMEANRFKEDAYGQTGPGQNTFDNTLKEAETVVSNLRRRLDKSEREVNIRKTHSQSVEFILYKVKDVVAKMKEGPNSEVAVSEFSLNLQRLLDQHETQSRSIQKQFTDLDWAEFQPSDSEEGAVGNKGPELKPIKEAVQQWIETMGQFGLLSFESRDQNDLLRYQTAAMDLMLILNGHCQTVVRGPEKLENVLKTWNIFDIIQDQFESINSKCVKEAILWKIWERPDALNIFETERKVCEKRLADCENTFGEGSPYYKYVADKNTYRMKRLDEYIARIR